MCSYTNWCFRATYQLIKSGLPVIQKIGTALGFTAALGNGVLAGIESAIMWSQQKLLVGLSFGGSSCFVNSLTYYYVVMRQAPNTQESTVTQYQNNWKSNLFAVAAFFFGGVMFVSNFNSMYVSFTVLGDRLNKLGDQAGHDLPPLLLQTLGILFGVSSAVSGAIFNITVGNQLWNHLRSIIMQREDDSLLPDVRVEGDYGTESAGLPRQISLFSSGVPEQRSLKRADSMPCLLSSR